MIKVITHNSPYPGMTSEMIRDIEGWSKQGYKVVGLTCTKEKSISSEYYYTCIMEKE